MVATTGLPAPEVSRPRTLLVGTMFGDRGCVHVLLCCGRYLRS